MEIFLEDVVIKDQRRHITESDKDIINKWFEEAHKQTLETLPKFLKHLMNDYVHDYGTIIIAMTAGSIATLWAMNKEEQGGITGFQAIGIMWKFIKHWNHPDNKCGMRLIDYDDLLYPQYDYKFEKTIGKCTLDVLQQEASRLIDEHTKRYERFVLDTLKYEIDIKAFVEKYPDYYERRDHYDHLSMGTDNEWKEYHEKVKSGFEFAPREPYEPLVSNAILERWKTLSSGKLPYGF